MNEEWRTIKDFPNYAVSSLGRVKRIAPGVHTHSGKILKPNSTKFGYLRVYLLKNNKHHYLSIHRLVLEAFVSPCPNGHNANHKDGKKDNNKLENLEWATFSHNSIHAYSLKLGKGSVGSKNPNAKLKENEVYLIKKLLASTDIASAVLAKMFRVSQAAISDIKKGRRWGHIIYP